MRDLGNTVLVVEHDEETIRRADYVVDLGPGAGNAGGHLVAKGRPEEIERNADSLTGRYLSGELSIAVPPKRRAPNGKILRILGCEANNLKNVDLELPLGLLTVVTGVSGSGKSTLVNDILYRALAQTLYRSMERPGAFREIQGAEHRSTKSSKSIRRPSAARRARIPPPTPASSRPSANSSPCSPNRASAATAPAASAST